MELKKLLTEGPLKANTELRPLSDSLNIKALLTDKGIIRFNQKSYDCVNTSMDAALQEYPNQDLAPLFKSSGWQFWAWFNDKRQAWAPLEHLRAEIELSDSIQKANNSEQQVRTSDSHPLRIDSLEYPDKQTGLMGLTFCPGKITQGIYGGFWQRDLDKDLNVIQQWHTDAVITLMEAHEFSDLGVPQFFQAMNNIDIDWIHLPIRDMNIPDEYFKQQWQDVGPTIHDKLQRGKRIVLHCRGGLGRTGLLAAQILIESGVQAVDAIQQVRGARARTIETFGQEEYLLKMGLVSEY